MITGPLFKWFGSKWLSSKQLPEPQFNTIIEPFAGGAGYSLRHYQKNVILYERDPHIRQLWAWLIYIATEKDIREIPINIKEGTDIRLLDLKEGQKLLLKSWQRTNNVGDCWTISPWGNKPGQWTENTRNRVAEQIALIKHWEIIGGNGLQAFKDNEATEDSAGATWFIDPPYIYNYKYRSPESLDYKALARLIEDTPGQKIVCEAICQETGAMPNWLPFEFWASRITSRRKTGDNHHSKELLWLG